MSYALSQIVRALGLDAPAPPRGAAIPGASAPPPKPRAVLPQMVPPWRQAPDATAPAHQSRGVDPMSHESTFTRSLVHRAKRLQAAEGGTFADAYRKVLRDPGKGAATIHGDPIQAAKRLQREEPGLAFASAYRRVTAMA